MPQPTTVSHDGGSTDRSGARVSRCTTTSLSHANWSFHTVSRRRPTWHRDSRRLTAVGAARAPAGLERGGDRSAGPAGGRAARGERSEPP